MQILRQEFAGLAGKRNQDRAGFEQRQRSAPRTVVVDDRGNAVVRADLQKFRLELVAGPDIDAVNAVLEPAFFELIWTLWPFGVGQL